MAEEKSHFGDTPVSERDEPLWYFAVCILSKIQWCMVCQGIRYAASP